MLKLLRNDPQLEALSLHLETLIIRIESGQSLRQALQGAPTILCTQKWIDRWVPLRDRLLQGQSQALTGLQSFRNALVLEQKLGRLIRKKAFMPLFQALSVMLTSLILVLFTQFFGEEIFQFRKMDYLVEFFFFLVGGVWIFLLIKNLFSDLWMLDWIDFLSSLDSQMSWGQNLLSAWKNSHQLHLKFPFKLQKLIQSSYQSSQRYEALSNAILKETYSTNPLERRCWERWKQVHDMFIRNESIKPLLNYEAENSYKRLEEHLELKSEKLSGYLMLPLFLCFLPASLYVILIPMIRIFM